MFIKKSHFLILAQPEKEYFSTFSNSCFTVETD